ncbi:MAG TPA: methionyl-tRNA formyltransferase [Bacteroidota bacterium]
MRIIYMGTPDFAIPSLHILLEHHHEIAAVVTAPDKPRGRGQSIGITPVKKFALEHRIPILQPENLRDAGFVSAVERLQPDLIVVVAFRILPKEVYSIPKFGSFNLHASLLPKYRGAAPINWAIINGETETGVTTFFLQEKVDTGSVLLQARVKIGTDETAGELHDKLASVGAEIVLQTVHLIELGKAQPRTQDDNGATPAPKIFKDDCRINWKTSNRAIHNFVRGLSPVPCAWTMHEGKVLKIYRTQLSQDSKTEGKAPGSLVEVGKKTLRVATNEGTVSVLEIQQEGKKRMGIEEFLRGYFLRPEDRFD